MSEKSIFSHLCSCVTFFLPLLFYFFFCRTEAQRSKTSLAAGFPDMSQGKADDAISAAATAAAESEERRTSHLACSGRRRTEGHHYSDGPTQQDGAGSRWTNC